MKRITILYFFLLLTTYASGGLFAADLEEGVEEQTIKLRPFIFEKDSLDKFTLLTGSKEVELSQTILTLAERFILEVGNEGLQELYDQSVTNARDAIGQHDTVKLMKNRDLATLAAWVDRSIKLNETFVHGLMIQAEPVLMLTKINFNI